MSNYSWITISEAAIKMRTNTRRIRYLLDNGELADNGKTGHSRRVKWEINNPEDQNGSETHEEAKRRKTIAEANLIEQKSIEFQAQLFDKWSNEFFSVFIHAFAPFRNYVIELRLDAAMTQKINELFGLCMQNLSQDLKSIPDSINTGLKQN